MLLLRYLFHVLESCISFRTQSTLWTPWMGFESSQGFKYVQDCPPTADKIRIHHLRIRESQAWLVPEEHISLFIISLTGIIEINEKEIRVERND
jgi:hypothetical protein